MHDTTHIRVAQAKTRILKDIACVKRQGSLLQDRVIVSNDGEVVLFDLLSDEDADVDCFHGSGIIASAWWVAIGNDEKTTKELRNFCP